mmetsp:Transcript_65343/g.181713  ORF Transcript_65343/g.181713 Transcript_65343/m.181713 type:complete len:222 (-) Transcript_65343:763-1428(-)
MRSAATSGPPVTPTRPQHLKSSTPMRSRFRHTWAGTRSHRSLTRSKALALPKAHSSCAKRRTPPPRTYRRCGQPAVDPRSSRRSPRSRCPAAIGTATTTLASWSARQTSMRSRLCVDPTGARGSSPLASAHRAATSRLVAALLSRPMVMVCFCRSRVVSLLQRTRRKPHGVFGTPSILYARRRCARQAPAKALWVRTCGRSKPNSSSSRCPLRFSALASSN